MDASEAFERSLGCGPEAIDQPGLLNSFEGTRLAICPPGVGPRLRSLPSAHSSPPAQPVPASPSAPEVAQILRQWSYEQLMARDKQTPTILGLITTVVETFQQSTDQDLRRETAAQLEKIIYS
ncbi:hypothetical protein Q8A73_009164 [Channa argus]|nr:hypothetical protein Q8A73_009164 [Channa argus]